MKKSDKAKILQNLALVSQIGISMTVPVLIGIFIGKFLDNLLNTSFIFLLIFTIFGIGAAFVNLYKITSKGYNRKWLFEFNK